MKQWQNWLVFLFVGVAFIAVPGTSLAAISCDSFTVTPAIASPGDFVTFEWTTTDVDLASIEVIGNVATTGSALYEVPNTPGDFSYELTLGNFFEESTSCFADLSIVGLDPVPVCDFFTVTPDTLNEQGDVTLEWGTTNADISVAIDNGVGFVAEDDNLTVSVGADTTFTLTAEGTFGTTQCTTLVTFEDPKPVSTGSKSGGGKSISPKCELTVSESKVKKGATVMVSWQSENAEQLNLFAQQAGLMNLLLSTTTNTPKGSFTVVVTADTTFTAEVTRPNRSNNCAIVVTLMPDDLFQAGVAGATGFISLTEVPETGLDPTVGFLIIFNLFLAFGALMGAYVLVQFTQQYKRASDSSFRDLHVFTPVQTLFLQERRYWQSRIMLWKWFALAIPLTLLVMYIL
jgi:hypothetical protein